MNYQISKQKKKLFLKTPIFIGPSINTILDNNRNEKNRKYRNRYNSLKWNLGTEQSFREKAVEHILESVMCLVCERYIISHLRYIPDISIEDLENQNKENQQIVVNFCNQHLQYLIQLDDIIQTIVLCAEDESLSVPNYDFIKILELVSKFKELTFSGCCSPTCREFITRGKI